MVSFSYPLVFSGVAIFVALYIDRIAIKELLGLEELGIYGIAYRFAAVASLVMIGFQSSLSPLIYKHYKEEETPRNIAKLFDGFVLFALFVVSGSVLFSKEVIVLMSTEAYYDAAILVPPLVMAVFFSNMYIFAPGMGIAKKTKTLAFISVTSAIINTILNYTLIPIFGLQGAAFATLFSSMIVFSMHVFVSDKYYKIPHAWHKKILLFITVLIVSYFVNNLFNDVSLVSVIVKILTILLITGTVIYSLIGPSLFKKIKVLFNNLG